MWEATQKHDFYYQAVIKLSGEKKDSLISGIQFCKTDSNLYLVEYQTTWDSNQEGEGKIFFATTKPNELVLSNPLTIPNPGISYLSCGEPLLLTKDNNLYYSCSGSKNASINESENDFYKLVYQINLEENAVKLISKCILNSENQQEIAKCE